MATTIQHDGGPAELQTVGWASYSYLPSFAWGLVTLAAFTGWGCAAARAVRLSREDYGWAVAAAWGMGVVIGLGGTLALFGAANRIVLIAIAAVGCVLAALWFRPGKWDWGAAAIFAVSLVFWYAPAVACRDFEPYDDYLAYIPFAQRFLDTGTLMEPFGYRRLTTYGGQSLLEAFTVSTGSAKNMNLLDCGVAMVVMAALVYGMLRRTVKRMAAFAGTIAVLLIPIARHNTMSQATGLVVWLGLFAAIRVRAPVLVGLALAAMCALRSNYIAAAALVAAWLLISDWRQWRMVGMVLSAALLPWAVLLLQSSGTIMYPLFRGFERMSYSAGAGWQDMTGALGRGLTDPNVLFLIVPLVLARGAAVPFAAAAVMTVLIVPLYLPFSDGASVYRYAQPVALGSIIVVLCGGVSGRLKKSALIVMLPILGVYAAMTVRERAQTMASLPAQVADHAPLFPSEIVERYARLEAAVPPGEAIYAVLPFAPLLDYRTHRIYNADLIGCASPPPGMPFFNGPAALKRYFAILGIRYVAFNDFDHPAVETGYWRWWWRNRAASRNPVLGPMVPYTLDLMNNIERLAATETVAVRSGDLVLLDLGRHR